MKTSDFTFELPPERIAQFPPERRGESRLMVIRRAHERPAEHETIRELPRFVEPGTVVVLNDSRVRKARLYSRAEKSGGQVEFLLLRRQGGEVVGPTPLPTEFKKYTVNRSTFVHKTAREQFELRVHNRIIDIVNPSQKIIESLSTLNLPSGVDIEIKMK